MYVKIKNLLPLKYRAKLKKMFLSNTAKLKKVFLSNNAELKKKCFSLNLFKFRAQK